ncbi:MAG: hypothetical protein WC700_18350 [Gemmatimonadaceae bacterium]|jgi:hypothetical protein
MKHRIVMVSIPPPGGDRIGALLLSHMHQHQETQRSYELWVDRWSKTALATLRAMRLRSSGVTPGRRTCCE